MNMFFPLYNFATDAAVSALALLCPGVPDIEARQRLVLDTSHLTVIAPTPDFGYREIAGLNEFRLTAALLSSLQTARILQALERGGASSWNPSYTAWSFLDKGLTSAQMFALLEEGTSFKLHVAALNAQFEQLPTDKHVRGSEQQAMAIRRVATLGELVKVNPITHLKEQDFKHLQAAMKDGLKVFEAAGHKLSGDHKKLMVDVIARLENVEHLLVIDKSKFGL